MRVFPIVSALLFTLVVACGSYHPTYYSEPDRYTRDSDEPWIDDPALSTRLDKRDLERMFGALIDGFMESPFYQRQRGTSPPPAIAIAPLSNETSEHIDGQLKALLAKMETQFLKDGGFRVIARERQTQIAAEVDTQQTASFDPRHAAAYGRLIGTEFLVTGKVFAAAERASGMRRVQYMAFMQVISVDTSEILWQDEMDVTKAYVAGQ